MQLPVDGVCKSQDVGLLLFAALKWHLLTIHGA
jgi:hypothetical protein